MTRNAPDTNAGPSDWFTGDVYLAPIASPAPPSRLAATSVHFTPGARTAWHTHPFGQTIYVIERVGLNRFVTHIAMQEADEAGSVVTRGEHVTDAEYGAAPVAV